VVVVRYFGGTLLGVSGLINAYKNAAADALKNATIVSRQIEKKWQLNFTYNELSEVMNLVKQENLTLLSTRFEEKCELIYSVRKNNEQRIAAAFDNIYGVTVKSLAV
jgi:putative IMPACT (imprinted ancient) family translation regulator